MAMTQAQTNSVLMEEQLANTCLQLISLITQINTLYNGAPDYAHNIAGADLTTKFGAGVTTTDLNNVAFMAGSILTAIDGQLPSLSVLANLGGPIA